jgi:hypothetical protein
MKTTIFTGPSLAPSEIRAILPEAQVLPPVKRGDIYRAREDGSTRILIIDGSFTHVLPVSPKEIVDVALDGAEVFGASSMGAVRAAECWPAGVRGVGAVYRMYRFGLFDSDDPVAVATDPENDYAAVSVALVNIHASIRRLQGLKLITASQGAELYRVASEAYYPDRLWPLILKKAGVSDPDGLIKEACAAVDIKKVDALRAVHVLAATPDRGTSSTRRSFDQGPRYTSHDPMLGYDREQLSSELTSFIFGSGRFKKYLSSLLSEEPEFRDTGVVDHPMSPRDPSVERTLARLLQDRQSITERLTDKFVDLGQFHTEIMLWHAMVQLKTRKVSSGIEVTNDHENGVKESLARAHGYQGWDSLVSDARDGLLPNGIPLQWIEDARLNLTFARAR